MQREDVHISFGQKRLSFSGDALAGLRQTVEVVPLLVDGRIRAVDVLGLVLVGDDAAAERDDLVGQVLDGEHEPSAEAVIGPPPVRLPQQAAFHGELFRKAAALQGPGQGLPVPPGPAQTETLHDVRRQAAPFHIGAAFLAVLVLEGRGEVGRRHLGHAQHLLPGGTFLPVPLPASGIRRAALQRHAGFGGKLFQRLTEIEAVDAAIKIEQVARGLTAETIEQPLFLIDGEGRLGLLMEGTRRDPARAVAFELHITAHHIHDVEPFLDGANGIPRLHTAEAPPGRKHDGAPCRTRSQYDKSATGLVKAPAKKFFYRRARRRSRRPTADSPPGGCGRGRRFGQSVPEGAAFRIEPAAGDHAEGRTGRSPALRPSRRATVCVLSSRRPE